ncbi:MAG: hypothetical protein U0939_07475 [Pirellulales bacterium]
MSTNETRMRAMRVLAAVDESPDGLAALEAAAALAAGLPGELAGLFVEDECLMRAAALPFTCELGIGTARSRPLEMADIQRRFAAVAKQLREQLERTAQRARLRWSFETVRGAVVRQTMERAVDVDFVVLGRHGLAPRSLGASRSPAPGRRPAPLLVVFDGDAASQRSLAAAASLARERRTQLEVYLSPVEKQQTSELQFVAVSRLEELHVRARVHASPLLAPAALLDAARRTQPQLLFVGATNRLLDERLLESLVSDLHCPVAIGYP